MPARVSARASSTTSSRKSSVQPSRAAPTISIPEEAPLPSSSPHLRLNIVEIFADAQRSTTGHRKLVVRLRKIQEGCCGLRSQPAEGKKAKKKQVDVAENGGTEDGGVAEKEFNTEIARCVL